MDKDMIAAILFFLPAGLANMSPVIFNRIPLINQWKTPIDFGKKLNGKRLFGGNKTWRGLLLGTLVGGVSAVIIGKLNQNVIGYNNQFVVGLLLGFGALSGDAIESMFKRQMNIEPGHSWFPFDQLDYIIGGLLAVSLVSPPPLWVIGTVLAVFFWLHLAVSFLGYKLGLKNTPI
jgi:CDP-2,3-bis-(O-geranylgeranyl)-sn-glycerol synthase